MSTTVGTDARGVAAAADALRAGGVLLYPTETVYGLGCDPGNDAALDRIRALKGRGVDHPMLALTDSWERVAAWFDGVTRVHERLMGHPGPLTILFEAGPGAPAGLRGPTGLVGVRRTADAFCRSVIAMSDLPLVSTSANPTGAPAPSSFAEVDAGLLAGVDLAVDVGRGLAGAPSTVVRVPGREAVVVREGAVAAAEVQRWVEGG